MTIPQTIQYLIDQKGIRKSDLAEAMKISIGSMLKIMRGKKELSFLMAVRMLKYFNISLADFTSLLSQRELDRQEIATIKYWEKQELRKAEKLQAKPISKAAVEEMTGKELIPTLMERVQSSEQLKELTKIFEANK